MNVGVQSSEEYKGYSIKVNRVPEIQFNFGTGFGWGFQVPSPGSQQRLFIVVLKSLCGKRTQANLQEALELGRAVIHSLIDKDEFEVGSYYCYQWEPDGPEHLPLTRVDCNKISPPPFRSP